MDSTGTEGGWCTGSLDPWDTPFTARYPESDVSGTPDLDVGLVGSPVGSAEVPDGQRGPWDEEGEPPVAVERRSDRDLPVRRQGSRESGVQR